MFVRIAVALVFVGLAAQAGAASAARPALIPLPTSVTWLDGEVRLTSGTKIEGLGAAEPTAAFLSQSLGIKPGKGAGRIRLDLVPAGKMPGPEAYHLRATGKEILIEASDPRGLFYGVQTLRQLVTAKADGLRTVPSVEIRDAPRFAWRGLLIDEGRHFFGKPTLLKIIDEMAAYKLNSLKLHLTDYEGWRLEIPGYPKLTQVGAMVDGTPQYFTTADMQEIVQYAADRYIMVVPEIEMPGHAGAAARSYP